MATIAEITAQIRFSIEQMSYKNEHHNFEHLCRHIARQRICSNILPATGPVSSGGDQGRDFETFKTYLVEGAHVQASFVGLASDKPIAFACTLQREDIEAKIQADVQKITASGSPVVAVHYFSGRAEVPTGKRHELQAWAKKERTIDLEIYDGQALSEMLADRDLFWVAQEFLKIPAELYPRSMSDDDTAWYVEFLSEWQTSPPVKIQYYEFSRLQHALRYATETESVRQDLPLWLKRLDGVLGNLNGDLRRMAIYETAVASLKGLGTLSGKEDLLREFFDAIPSIEDPTDLQDASILWFYVLSAAGQNQAAIQVSELSLWRKNLIKRTEALIAVAKQPGYTCRLLHTRGYLCLTTDPAAPKTPDVDGAFSYWSKLVKKVKHARLYPLERFASFLVDMLPYIGEHPRYGELTQEVDRLLAERAGGFVAGEKCAARAEAAKRAGKLTWAIDELHRAKINWYADETLPSAVDTILRLSECYSELGLAYAAKYYALAAAAMGLDPKKPEVQVIRPTALCRVAAIDYVEGAWVNLLQTVRACLAAQYTHGAPDETEDMVFIVQTIATVVAVSELVNHDLHQRISKELEPLLQGLPANLLEQAQDFWRGKGISELQTLELVGAPFCDVGATREITWNALGIKWSLVFANEYDTTAEAEQLAAVLQILMADLASIDLYVLKTSVRVNVTVGATPAERNVEPVTGGGRHEWNVTISKGQYGGGNGFSEVVTSTLSMAIAILHSMSLLPLKEFMSRLRTKLKDGLTGKVFVGRPFAELWLDLISDEQFNMIDRRLEFAHPQIEPFFPEVSELSWVGGRAPEYSMKVAITNLKGRYLRLPRPVGRTLARLAADDDFLNTVRRLRSKGWKDWHILSCVANLALNYRYNKENPEGSLEHMQSVMLRALDAPEPEDAIPIPKELFSEENLEFHRRPALFATLNLLKLEYQGTWADYDAVEHFLAERFGYWDDDIDHSDPFQG